MGIDLKNETRIDLVEAPHYLGKGRNGRPMHIATLIRAVTRGIRGVRLEALRFGNRWVTSVEALERWGVRMAETSVSPETPTARRSRRTRQLDDDRAAAELKRRGF